MSFRLNLWSVGLFLLIILFYLGAVIRSTLAWAPFVIVILFIVAKANRLNIRARDFRDMRWFLAVIGWTYASILWSIDPAATIDALRNLIPKIVIFFFAYKFPIWQKETLRNLGLLIGGAVFVIGLYLIARYGEVRIPYRDYVLYGISYSNIIAAGIVASIPLIMFNKSNKLVSGSNIFLLLLFYMVILTESRAGIVLSILAFILSLSFFKSINMMKWIVSLALLVALLFVAVKIFQSQFPNIFERLSTIGNTLSVLSDSDVSNISWDTEDYARKLQYVYTIEQMGKIPILGVGYSAFGAAIEKDTGTFVQAHSLFGNFFVELGIIGFALFLVFNFTLIRALWRKINDLCAPEEARVARMAFVELIMVNLLYLSRPEFAEVTYFVALGIGLAATKSWQRSKETSVHEYQPFSYQKLEREVSSARRYSR